MRGVSSDGQDVRCPSCSARLLERVAPREVLDLVIVCSCGYTLETTARVAGEGLGGVLIPVAMGQHHPDTLENDCGAHVVGLPTLEQRAHETGQDRPPPERVVADVAGIELELERARAVFRDVLARVEERERRRAARGTPEDRVHRLVQLIVAVERNLGALRAGGHEVDVLSLVELSNSARVFARWDGDPLQPTLLAESVEPTTFLHNVGVLTVASRLVDLGVELVPQQPGVRRPDLRARPAPTQSFEVEVKAPSSLQRRPGVAVAEGDAIAEVVRLVDSAAKQFSQDTPRVVAITGSAWSGDLDRYIAAVNECFRRRSRPELAAVVLASTSTIYVRQRGAGAFSGDWREVDWGAETQAVWLANPSYGLSLQVGFDPGMTRFDISFRPEMPCPPTSST